MTRIVGAASAEPLEGEQVDVRRRLLARPRRRRPGPGRTGGTLGTGGLLEDGADRGLGRGRGDGQLPAGVLGLVMIRRMPGRAAARPRRPSRCRSRSCDGATASTARPVRRGRREARWRGRTRASARLAMRSLPPPILQLLAVRSSDHSIGSPNSRKVWLKAGRWPSRSVSASTPSQSKTRALTRPSRRSRTAGCARAAISITAARWRTNSAGGSYSPGCSVM